MTLLVHPARQEPLGRVLLEAAAAGTAVVATSVGGTPEIFPPESESAVLVAVDDDHALGDAISKLLGDFALWSRMASAARRRAEEQFDVQTAVSRLIEHYRAVT